MTDLMLMHQITALPPRSPRWVWPAGNRGGEGRVEGEGWTGWTKGEGGKGEGDVQVFSGQTWQPYYIEIHFVMFMNKTLESRPQTPDDPRSLQSFQIQINNSGVYDHKFVIPFLIVYDHSS